MTAAFAPVAFVNEATGARIEGQFIADTGPTWLMKPAGKAVIALRKDEWNSVTPDRRDDPLDDILGQFLGGQR